MSARTAERVWFDFDLVDRAQNYAALAHRDDLRKATAIPYLSHLWSVAALVLEHGGDDTQVAAALLHDVVEDHGGAARLQDVSRHFGAEVAAIVEALSDSLADTEHGEAKPPWKKRKKSYLAHLTAVDERVALVSACDKLHNARAILTDLRADCPNVWSRFSETDPDEQRWYYRSLVEILSPKVPRPLGDAMRETVQAIETLVRSEASSA